MYNISAKHDSYVQFFRSPQGAVLRGADVVLRLQLAGRRCGECLARLRLWNGVERVIEGVCEDAAGVRTFTFRFVAPDKPCLLWYNFRVSTPDGDIYCGAADGCLRCGKGVLTSEVPHDFRITVYDSFETPEWFRKAIVYQIFPDRFRCGSHPGAALAMQQKQRTSGAVAKAWNDEVDFLPRSGNKYYIPNDFFLGNLQGVIDEIPYLKSLGVTAVYLNPIFESPFNHRYSISDYLKIDPLLGNENDFLRMTDALHKNGIRVILDGVFSHTGDDSVYFNRYGHYASVGAYQSRQSPYYKWYEFRNFPNVYRCWWDFDTLPEVNELEPSYIEFVYHVLEKWNALGADGWRLDVADELPDEFIRLLRKKLKSLNPQAVLIGEVWEDAATKRGGEGRRGYVNGDELDGVMNYPFADAVCAFLLGTADAQAAVNALSAQKEGYPAPFYAAQFGMLGSHDTVRILTRLSDAPPRNALDRSAQHAWRPSEQSAALGKKRIMQAAALQFSMPFPPCIYYGDEVGLTGMADPFCRRPYPWGREDNALLSYYRTLSDMRTVHSVFFDGCAQFFAYGADVLCILRSARNTDGEIAVTLINRADRPLQVALPVPNGMYNNVLTGAVLPSSNGILSVCLPANGTVILISDDTANKVET